MGIWSASQSSLLQRMSFCSLDQSWDYLPGALDTLTINWASDCGFGYHSITTPRSCRLVPVQLTRGGRKTCCLSSALLVCLGLTEKGEVSTSSPQHIPSVTQSLRRKPWLLGPFPNGTVSQAAQLRPLFPSPPFSPELGDRDGHFPLWLYLKGRNIFLWLTKTKGEMR